MVVIVATHSSSLSNPCPSGTGIGYGEFNGTIFVICDAAFAFNHISSADPLALGLGLGLGLGIPIIGIIVWGVVYMNNWWCYRNKYEVRPLTIAEIRAAYSRDHERATTPEEYVKLKLGPELFQQFIQGNLTNELKKKLFALREERGRHLIEFKIVAKNLNQDVLLTWIKNLSYTTLQDERIV